MRLFLLSGTLCLFIWGCKPKPIHTALAGYTIEFPTTIAELQQKYPNGYKSDYNKFIDSSRFIRVEWWFDAWGGGGNQNPSNQPHGVVIFIKNKGNKFDSVKTALEQRYKQNLKPLITHTLKGNFAKLSPPIYTCYINEETILVLTKAARYRGDPWSQYNSLRISIGYKLSIKEQESFALLDGGIHNDVD